MDKFSGPIPGQSLTKAPGTYPWDNPPEMTNPEQVIQFHLMRFDDQDRLNTAMDALEFGVTDLYTLVKGIMRSAVSQGIHTIEAGMIAAPVVHTLLKEVADSLGFEYNDGINEGTRKEQEQKARASLKAQKMLKDMGVEIPEIEREEAPAEDLPEVEVEEAPTDKPRGLMSREAM